MAPSREYIQFSAFLELIESMSAGRQTESLTFRDGAGRVVGLLTLDGGQVRFGVHLAGRLYIDEILLDEAPRYAGALQKILNRHSLSRAEKDLLTDISPQHHAALCGLTARALRKIAALYVPSMQPGRRPESGLPQLRLLNASFSPVELALAAARRGSIRPDDVAARVYANPPEFADEVWLFEWQTESSGSPWPVQTSRLGERHMPDLSSFGALGQQLAGFFMAPRRLGDKNKRQVQLLRVSETLFLLVCSARYLTVLQYHQVHLGRLLKSMEDLVAEASVRAPDIGSLARSRISPPAAPAPPAGGLRPSLLPPLRPALARPVKQVGLQLPRESPGALAKIATSRQAVQVPPAIQASPASSAPAIAQESELLQIDEAAWVEAAAQLVDDATWLDATSLLISEDAAPAAATAPAPVAAPTSAPTETTPAGAALTPVTPAGGTPEEPSAPPPEPIPEPAPTVSVPAASDPDSVLTPSMPSAQIPEPEVVLPDFPDPPSAAPVQSLSVAGGRQEPETSGPETAPSEPSPRAPMETLQAPNFRPALLSLNRLTARVEGRTILKDIELELGSRGVYALMGPGGSGKSSLAGILCGRNRAASGWELTGELRYDGAPLGSGPRPVLIGQKIGRSTLSLRAYLVADLDEGIASTVSDSELVDRLARVQLQRLGTGLRSALGSPALQLSRSEWWRLAIARELMADPRMLCVDEPTADMGDEEADPILNLLRAEGAKRAVLFVTHNQQHARRCSDYVILLASGSLQEYRPTPEFFSSPTTRAAQDYVRTGGCYVPSPDADQEQLDEGLRIEGLAATPRPAPPGPAPPSPAPPPAIEDSSVPVSSVSPAPASPPTLLAPRAESESSASLWRCPTPLLSARHFSLRIGERTVFAELCFDVGPNGAFLIATKNSGERRLLIRALCGPRPSSFQLTGLLRYRGQDLVDGEGPVTPQASAQLLMMKAADYVGSNLRARSGLTQAEQRTQAKSLLERVGLSELRERLHLEMTSLEPLERRSLEILRAIAPEPPLLVLEDPLSGLALDQQERLLALLRQQVQQRSVLLLVQDVAPYAQLDASVAWLVDGRMFADPPQQTAAAEAAPQRVAPTEAMRSSVPQAAPAGGPSAGAEQLSDAVTDAQPPLSRGQGPRGFQWLREGSLAGMPAPGLTHALDYDLDLVRRTGVTYLVTLTTSPLPSDALRAHALQSVFFPIEDMDAPSEQAAAELAANVAGLIARQQAVAFHCKAGLGRTGTMLAAQLIWEGMDARSALGRVRTVEPGWVQSEKQLQFLSRYEQWLRRTQPQGSGWQARDEQTKQARELRTQDNSP